MKKTMLALVIVLVICMMVSVPISALSSTTSGDWYVWFVYYEDFTPIPFLLHLGGKLFFSYSNYTTPWPGYHQIVRNSLDSVIYDYYAPFPYANYPFGVSPGIISIKRYYNDSLNLTITDLTPYSYIADPDDRWMVGENFTNSYLVKNAGDVYRFVGTVGFLSDCSPWYIERTITKNFSY